MCVEIADAGAVGTTLEVSVDAWHNFFKLTSSKHCKWRKLFESRQLVVFSKFEGILNGDGTQNIVLSLPD